MKDKIAIIDDHEDSLELLREALSPSYDVETFSNPIRALEEIKTGKYSAVVSDIMMPGMTGTDLLDEIVKTIPGLPVILITAFGRLDAAASSIKAGAYDYISKPLNLNEIRFVISNAVSHFKHSRKLQLEDKGKDSGIDISGVIGFSEKMLKVFKMLGRVAPTNSNVLIQGESGTGKELVAKSIHMNSPRADKPFVPVSIAAIPEQLLEAELFGHEKGAFTGALFARDGLFSEADGGTLFLDEIGEIPLSLQPKLLRALQEHEVRRIGSTTTKHVDVRIIAATNRDLSHMVKERLFREDLFYRLSVIRIQLPPLRERKEDIPPLVKHFINKYNHMHNKNIDSFSDELMEMLMGHDWPGNVRELENFVDRAIALAAGPVVDKSDVEVFEKDNSVDSWLSAAPHRFTLDELQEAYLRFVLKKCNNDYSEAAKLLNINKSTIYRKIGPKNES
ncbi:MAG: sigma-54-dependent transcriptional regulator [Candidatus Kryptoniota bacterium]